MLAAAVLALSAATTAQAHGETGLISIDAASPGVATPNGEPGMMNVQVRIAYANDGEPATGATATATATEAGGTTTAPVTLADAGDGSYTGALAIPTPGSWTVHVESTEPAASADQTVEVAAATTTTTSSSGASATDGSGPAAQTRAERRGSSDTGTTTAIIVAIVAVLVGAGLTAWLIARRRARGADPA